MASNNIKLLLHTRETGEHTTTLLIGSPSSIVQIWQAVTSIWENCVDMVYSRQPKPAEIPITSHALCLFVTTNRFL